MSRTFRFAAALLILASLTCGSLGALPFGSRTTPAQTARGDFLTRVVEWVVSLFAPSRPTGEPPEPMSQAKEGSSMDPQGSGGSGGGGH